MTFRVPRLNPGCDLKSLPLKPAEAFLLSRIDGIKTERDLALLTGMSHGELVEALQRLRTLGAIRLDDEATEEQGQRSAVMVDAGQRAAVADVRRPPPGAAAGPAERDALNAPAPPRPYDAAELDEAVELVLERKKRILDLYYQLEDLSYYELLGIPNHSDKKQIKAAYYQLAPEFHPDTYFRKQLGSYKTKIETIFNRITLAHDTLTLKQRRSEYDQYLEQTSRNREMAAMIARTPQEEIDAAVSVLNETVQSVTEAAQAKGVPPQRPPTRPATPAPSPAPALTAKERRETFARKLAGGMRRSSGAMQAVVVTPTVTAASGERPPESVRAAESLKERYDAARADALRNQIERYSTMARVALERKDFAGATNAYKIAASLAPDDAELQRASSEVHQLAAAALADGYLKQARYEVECGRWSDAALSYAKVCDGRPDDAVAHERVAYATLQSGGNTRRAVEFARRAVELVPDSVEFRATLALVYAAAGFAKSAAGELDRAAELARNDAKLRELIAQTRELIRKNGKQA